VLDDVLKFEAQSSTYAQEYWKVRSVFVVDM
jgi:hypothetical protein